MELKLTMDIVIDVPKVPNFILSKSSKCKYPLNYFTDEQLKEIGNCWVEALIGRKSIMPHEARMYALEEPVSRSQ